MIRETHSAAPDEVLRRFAELSARGEGAALITVVRAPEESRLRPGEKALVTVLNEVWSAWPVALPDEVLNDARLALAHGSSIFRRYTLEGERDPIEVFIEVVPETPKILIVGAGHIGQALAKLGKIVGFRIALLDDRPEWASRERCPEADEIICADFEDALAAYPITPATNIVIVTRGHRQDAVSLEQVIRSPAAYIGMIGSPRRGKAVFQLLEQHGVPPELLRRVHTPIGLDIGAETPAEIAVSILAEIILEQRGGTGRPLYRRRGPGRELDPEE